MRIDIGSIITLDDDKEYIVVSKAVVREQVYYYLKENEDNENICFGQEVIENGAIFFDIIVDNETISLIAPALMEAAMKALPTDVEE